MFGKEKKWEKRKWCKKTPYKEKLKFQRNVSYLDKSYALETQPLTVFRAFLVGVTTLWEDYKLLSLFTETFPSSKVFNSVFLLTHLRVKLVLFCKIDKVYPEEFSPKLF